MSAVCCPSCWTWSELGNRTTCRKCGSPLVMASGQAVAEVLGAPPPPPPPPPGMAQPMYAAATPAGFPAPPVGFVAPPAAATDWVSIARVMTVVSGLLGAVGLLLVGLLVRHVTITSVDPRTGLLAASTVDLGPVLAVAAIVALLVTAGVVWGLGNRVFRIIWAGFTALTLVASVATLGTVVSSGTSTAFSVTVGTLAYRAAYLVVLWLSIVKPGPARYR